MKNLLAIDTATEACSVAIWNGEILFEKYQLAPRLHGELVLAMVDALLQQSQLKLTDIDSFVVNRGPGAFTGIRLGISVVQGLAYAVSKPVIMLDSLLIQAQGVLQKITAEGVTKAQIAIAMDARLNEVYWQCFSLRDSQLLAQTQAIVTPVDKLLLTENKLDEATVCAGTGWSVYADEFFQKFNIHFSVDTAHQFPRASWSIALTHSKQYPALDAENISPLYLRDKVAETTKERAQKKMHGKTAGKKTRT